MVEKRIKVRKNDQNGMTIFRDPTELLIARAVFKTDFD